MMPPPLEAVSQCRFLSDRVRERERRRAARYRNLRDRHRRARHRPSFLPRALADRQAANRLVFNWDNASMDSDPLPMVN